MIVLLAAAVSLLTADGVPGQAISSRQARVVCAVGPALVRIATTLAYQPGGGMRATGLIIDRYGHVLTNNHVVAGAGSISLTEVATGHVHPGTVTGTDIADDLAVVRMSDPAGTNAPTIGDSAPLRAGQHVYAIGAASGTCGTTQISPGHITALNQSVAVRDEVERDPVTLSGLILTDVKVRPGYSGGALADERGRVVGVVTGGTVSGADDRDQAAFAIPINTAAYVARQMIAGSGTARIHVGPTASLGIAVAAAQDVAYAPYVTGAVVVRIEYGAPAERLGMAVGDEILTLGGHPVRSAIDVARVLNVHRPGERIALTWDASGVRHAGSAVLVAGPPM